LTTWQYIPEDSKLHTRSRENMKSHMEMMNWAGHVACTGWLGDVFVSRPQGDRGRFRDALVRLEETK
jgi:hypothetical protein